MAANTSPIFTLTPHIGQVSNGTANTGRDGSGTLGTIITGTTNGTRVVRVTVTATGNTTAGMIRLFIDDGATHIRLWKELAVTAITVSATVQAWQGVVYMPGESALILPSGYILSFGTHNAETFVGLAEAGDY